MSLICIDL